MKRIVSALAAVAALLVPAAAADANPTYYVPVAYQGSAKGNIVCHSVYDGTNTYVYMETDPPTAAWRYAGTYKIGWVDQLYVWHWNGTSWGWTQATGSYQHGTAINPSYLYVNGGGFYYLSNWHAFAGTRYEGLGAPELDAVQGHYYYAREYTVWSNSAGQTIRQYANNSNVAQC